MKNETLRMLLSFAVTLQLFSIISLMCGEKGSAEYYVSLFSTGINLILVVSIVVILSIRKKNK